LGLGRQSWVKRPEVTETPPVIDRWPAREPTLGLGRQSWVKRDSKRKEVGKVMMANLMRWNPVDELQKFVGTFDRLVSRWRSGSGRNASPTYGSTSGVDDGYRVRIPLPGIAPENVTVDVAGRTIQVRAIERNGDTEVTCYEEVLMLPASVDPEKVGARFRHGLLELTLPYQDAVKPRRIAIETEERKQLSPAA
jgi:HSP20 family protein